MRTPRHSTSRSGRGFGTLIGNGWLRESVRNVLPREWGPSSRSALRKCMFMQMPPHVVELAKQLPPAPPAPVAAWQPREEKPIVYRRQSPDKDARMFPRVDPEAIRAKAETPRAGAMWWEDPIALGSLLVVVPPIGLACLWCSRRYSTDARWALTAMSALITCFAGAIVLALLVLR